jgi:thioredoxin-related protein
MGTANVLFVENLACILCEKFVNKIFAFYEVQDMVTEAHPF